VHASYPIYRILASALTSLVDIMLVLRVKFVW
jgi:hypothetical protein